MASSSSSSSDYNASVTIAELVKFDKVPLDKIIKLITDIVSECPNKAILFSTLVSMLAASVIPVQVYKVKKLDNTLQKIIDLQRQQGERLQNLEDDSGSLKAMLKEMQEQTREMREQTKVMKESYDVQAKVMKESYDVQINMLRESLIAIAEKK